MGKCNHFSISSDIYKKLPPNADHLVPQVLQLLQTKRLSEQATTVHMHLSLPMLGFIEKLYAEKVCIPMHPFTRAKTSHTVFQAQESVVFDC